MKPRLIKHAGKWWCRSNFFSITGHTLTAWGFGDTPNEAYAMWKAHWGVRKS